MPILHRGMATGPLPYQGAVYSATNEVASDRSTGGNKTMTFLEGFDLIRWARKRQDGQTMAEYAVVLGVITLAVVGVFTALSGGISGAISTVTGRI